MLIARALISVGRTGEAERLLEAILPRVEAAAGSASRPAREVRELIAGLRRSSAVPASAHPDSSSRP